MKDLTQGPVLRQLLGLAGLLLIGMVVQTLYSLIDLYWVGRLGPDAVAAVTVALNLFMLNLALSQMLGVGTGALVAQAVGAKQHESAHHVFNQALGLALLFMLAFAAAGWIGQGAYAAAFSANARTAQLVRSYLVWFIPALALQFPLMTMGAALRGTGNMRPATIAQVGTVLLNIVLAPFLIFGWLGAPRLGVAGAGLATLLAVAAGTLGLWGYFLRKRTYLELHPREWWPQAAPIRRILKIGLPSAVEFAVMSCYLLFITALLRSFGAVEQAAFGIGQRWLQAPMLPLMAISMAASALTGQNYGARQDARVHETLKLSLRIGLACGAVACLICELFAPQMIGLFSREPAVIAGGVEFLHVIGLSLLPLAVAFVCFGVLSGLGNTLPTLISSATRIALVVISALIVARHAAFRPLWLWMLSASATVVQMLMNLWFLRREIKRRLGSRDVPLAVQPTIEA